MKNHKVNVRTAESEDLVKMLMSKVKVAQVNGGKIERIVLSH